MTDTRVAEPDVVEPAVVEPVVAEPVVEVRVDGPAGPVTAVGHDAAPPGMEPDEGAPRRDGPEVRPVDDPGSFTAWLLPVLLVGVALVLEALRLHLPLLVLSAATTCLLLVHRFVIHPWHVRWGATRAEASAPLPGDELLDRAVVTTRAVTIDAPVEQVWDWVVELGVGPDGWCTPGHLAEGRSTDGIVTDGIVPALGDLGGGAGAPGAGYEVLRIEAPHTLVSRGADGTTWCLHLRDAGGGRTRLVSRFRSSPAGPDGSAPLADPLEFLRERRMLRGLRTRAESGAPMPRTTSVCVS